jgi:voltage-gated potassium channel
MVRLRGPELSPGQPRFRRSILRDLRARMRFSLVGLVGIASLHIVAMMALEGFGFSDAAWLTFTSITTTGYGDLAAKSIAGRAATITLIYFSGIFLLSQAASAFFELRAIRRERMRRGEWKWAMKDHIVFVNMPAEEPGDYLRRLIDQLRRSHAGMGRCRAVVVSDSFPDGMPATLEDDPDIVQVRGRFDDPAALTAAGVDQARFVVVLAEREGERLSDAYTFDVVHRLRERGYAGRIIAECVDDRNRTRLSRAGASAVVRPLRGYPEMIVRAIVAPGSERIVEQMFSSEGDECLRFDVRVQDVLWAEVAAALIGADYGTPLGYADADGGLHINPAPNEPTRAQALFLLVDERQRVCRDAVQRLVDELRAKQ